jgi:hypothetical protein
VMQVTETVFPIPFCAVTLNFLPQCYCNLFHAGIGPRALHLLGRHSTTVLHLQPLFFETESSDSPASTSGVLGLQHVPSRPISYIFSIGFLSSSRLGIFFHA